MSDGDAGRQRTGAYEGYVEAPSDLVLKDIQMPEMEGIQANRLISQYEERKGGPRPPVIAMTAHASRQQHDQCLAAGKAAAVTQPANISQGVGCGGAHRELTAVQEAASVSRSSSGALALEPVRHSSVMPVRFRHSCKR